MIDELVRAAQQSDWERAKQLLYAHWQVQCPKLLAPNADAPWDMSYDEQAISSLLFRPLAAAYVQDVEARTTSLAPLNEEAGTNPSARRPGQICGYVFKCGEPTYSCKECATDPTCVLCHECFSHSIHKNHKYRMSTSGGSGYCDCGDADAWKTGFACSIHEIKEGEETASSSTIVSLPTPLADRVRGLTAILMQYCAQTLCWSKDEEYPSFAKNPVGLVPLYQTVLFNDETHTYENVIRALELAIGCTRNQAMVLATIVDREGRSTVRAGSRQDCDRVKADIVRRTQRDTNRRTEKTGPLLVKVLESAFVAHQTHAIQIIAWLNQQIEHFPALSSAVGDVILNVIAHALQETSDASKRESSVEPMEPDSVDLNESIVEMFMRNDCHLWKAARNNFHQMLMKTVLMHMEMKYAFSRKFLELYRHMYQEFTNDDHDHDVSIVSLTVQFLTVPSIARRLIAEENALTTMFTILNEHASPYVSGIDARGHLTRFDFTQKPFPATLKRAMHILRDTCYLLNQIPKGDEWTPALRDNYVRGIAAFLDLLHHMQGMDAVKRQQGEHQTWEQEWETAFNIQIRQQEIITMMIAWAASDMEVHHRVMVLCLEACTQHKPSITEPGEPGETKTIVEVNGDSFVVPAFDVLRGAVSIHQPVYRLLAGLFAVDRDYLRFFDPEIGARDAVESFILDKISRMSTDLYEMALRVFVLCAQSASGLWRRNGFSLVNQIHNYHTPLCRTEMYDRDLLMLQVGAALTEPNDFLLHFLHRYRIDKWADEGFDGQSRGSNVFGPKVEPEESSKFLVSLAEDLLHTLILITGERWVPGVGECSREEQLNREVIHILCMGPQPFSAINKRISQDPLLEKLSLDTSVKAVAEFKKPTASSAGTFHLKEELRGQYNPFFYHYSKSDLSQAELHQEKTRPKLDRSAIACPPPPSIPFLPFFTRVPLILCSPVLIKLHGVVLERVAKRSRFSSDRLLHRVLYLIGMALNEQVASKGSFDFITPANQAELLPKLEALSGKQESSTHVDLLWWTIQKFKEVERSMRTDTADDHKGSCVPSADEPKEECGEDLRKKRAAKAAAMRQLALQKMQRMQKVFTDTMKKDTAEKEGEKTGSAEPAEKRDGDEAVESLPMRMDEDEDAVTKLSDYGFPVCLGPHKVKAEVVVPRGIKCILCQEEETLDEKARPFVCAAFVQRSHLFAQKARSRETQLDVHLVNAALSVGVDASTCSHTMHFECYQSLAESLLNRERNRPRQQMMYNQKMVDTENGEYLCPLCKRLSNTAMPLVPSLHLLPVNGFSTVSSAIVEEFDVWLDRVQQMVNAPPTAPMKTPVKSHSRKRSHSERALNDLVKQAEKDALAAGSLEGGLSSSVPSVSAMNLLENIPAVQPMDPAPVEMQRDQMVLFEQEARDAADMLNEMLRGRQALSPVSPSADDLRRAAGSSSGRKSDVGQFFASLPNTVLGMIAKMPQAVIAKFIKRTVPIEKFEECVRAFTKFIIKARAMDGSKELEDHVRGVMSAMGVWKSTAHVTRAVSTVLKQEGKPLFGALNTRQRDCVLAMSRLSALLSYNLQPFGEIIAQMLKVLLSPPPEAALSRCASDGATSPPHASSPPPHETSTPTAKLLTSPIAQFFMPSTPLARKDAHKENINVNLLHVDMLSLALELMMCIGWTWHDGHQLIGSVKQSSAPRDLVPDGSSDELHVLRLALVAHCFQVFATFDDVVADSEEHGVVAMDVDSSALDEGKDASEDHGAQSHAEHQLVKALWAKAREREPSLKDAEGLYAKLREAVVELLRPIALVYYSITLIPPPEALKDPFVDEYDPLCRYLGLPGSLHELLDGSATERLFDMWSCSVPPGPLRGDLVKQPVQPNVLVDLPDDFSDLINVAAKFRCPSVPLEEMASSVPTMCLICGEVLCSQSYCCQKQTGKEAKDAIGACQYHMIHCTGQSGVFLRIRDSQIALLTSRGRGCLKAAPYVDEFGEADVGFRRGNPLHLNREQYGKLRQLWLHQGIAEEVVNQFELDHRNMAYEWNHF